MFNMSDVIRSFKQVKYTEDEINQLLIMMDFHLSHLYEAIQENNQEQKDFHMEQLKENYQRLCFLEYFPIKNLRTGSNGDSSLGASATKGEADPRA